MKYKKVVMMSAAAAAFMSMSLNASAAQSVTDRYVDRLKKSGQIDLILDVEAYRAAYSDLEEAFGDDEDAYIKHYLTAGVYEERNKGVLFDPLAYAESYGDIMDAFGDDVLAIVSHYVTYGVKENRTAGTAAGYEDIAAAMEEGAVQSRSAASVKSSSVVSGSRAEGAGSNSVVSGSRTEEAGSPTQDRLSGFRIGHTTSIYADDGTTLIRVEYYDENNKLVYYSDVIGYDSATNSYTENIYSYDEKEQREVLEQTDTYVNGVCSSAK
ncbi:MAG: hypothetical protein NC517_01960 [Firmicutes bacterium]|nr:hypothetical protein [Bacillota bacterium]